VLRYARARDCRLFRFRARLRSIVSGLRFDRSILRRFIRVWRRRLVLMDRLIGNSRFVRMLRSVWS